VKDQTIKRVEQTVFDAYLEKGLAQTVNDIAAQSQLSASAIRNALRLTKRLAETTVEVPVMSKVDEGRVHQWREITAYYPTRQWLVEFIAQTRREADHRSQYGH
jgi:hypothetical protein